MTPHFDGRWALWEAVQSFICNFIMWTWGYFLSMLNVHFVELWHGSFTPLLRETFGDCIVERLCRLIRSHIWLVLILNRLYVPFFFILCCWTVNFKGKCSRFGERWKGFDRLISNIRWLTCFIDSIFDVICGLLRFILVDKEWFVTLRLFVVSWRRYTPTFLILDVFICD